MLFLDEPLIKCGKFDRTADQDRVHASYRFQSSSEALIWLEREVIRSASFLVGQVDGVHSYSHQATCQFY